MAAGKHGHRRHAPVRRDCRRDVLYTTDELALVEMAAAAVNLRPGAFAAAAAVTAAKARLHPRESTTLRSAAEFRTLRAEAVELRRLLGLAGGNLNQIAARANATGQPIGDITSVLAFTRRVLARIDSWVMNQLREQSL